MATRDSTENAISRAIVESSQDAIIGKSLQGIILAWNRGAEHVYGYTAAEATGQSMTLLLPEDRPNEELEILERIVRGEQPDHFETVRRTKSGQLIDVSLTISPLRDEHDRIIGVSHVARNITERKRLDEELRRLAAIVESSDDAIISKSTDGTVLTWNGGAERVYGYTVAEAIGQRMTLLLPDDRPTEEVQILDRISLGEQVTHFETIRRTKNGRLIDVSLTISPIRDQHNVIVGASHVARDVTERKQSDREFRHAQKLESLGVLAGGIAHDFNNLLTGILGNTSLVLEILPTVHPGRELLRDVLNASNRASRLTRQLLAYAGEGRFVIELIDLSLLVRETSTLIHTSIPTNVCLQLDLRDELSLINGDVSQLEQLVMNLIINASEAVGPDASGTVSVSTSMQNVDTTHLLDPLWGSSDLATGSYVGLEVRDTGCGMDQETISRIFDPFFTTKFAGRGLGLAAIQGIVRGHNGRISVHSHPGAGTTFRILLPATQGAALTKLTPTPQPLAQGQLILLIDDEDMIRRTTAAILEHCGYTVVAAESGQDGVGLYRMLEGRVSAVLLDMTMPVMNGEETFVLLKGIDPEVKVILCSGFSELDVISQFTGKGLAGFIQKPYSVAELADVVASVIREPVRPSAVENAAPTHSG